MKDFKSNLDTLFTNMENFISTKTVVGEPIHIGDTIILPLVDVFFGVGTSSTDGKNGSEKPKPPSDKGGLGAKIVPSAVLIIKNNTVQLVNVKNQDSLNKLIDMAPSLINKIQESIFKKGDKTDNVDGEKEILKDILENENEI